MDPANRKPYSTHYSTAHSQLGCEWRKLCRECNTFCGYLLGSNLLAKLLEYFELRDCCGIALAQRSSKALSATGGTVS